MSSIERLAPYQFHAQSAFQHAGGPGYQRAAVKMESTLAISASRTWTRVGLLIALFGLPAIVSGYHFAIPLPTESATAAR
jgi:hypothetical protein